MAFGKEIKRLRNAVKVSAQTLADAIGIDAEKLRKWEQRDSDPSHEDRVLIEKFFRTNLDNLIKLDRLPDLTPPKKSYLERRREQKNGDKPDIPGYIGNTKMGNFEAYADDPEMQTPVGYFDSRLFPGCNHAEKVNGDSMYPLIVNQGWIIGKIIDKGGMISGEKYCLHLKNGQNITKYVHNLPNRKEYVKIVSHNKSVPDDVVKRDDINLCIRVYFIINPS